LPQHSIHTQHRSELQVLVDCWPAGIQGRGGTVDCNTVHGDTTKTQGQVEGHGFKITGYSSEPVSNGPIIDETDVFSTRTSAEWLVRTTPTTPRELCEVGPQVLRIRPTTNGILSPRRCDKIGQSSITNHLRCKCVSPIQGVKLRWTHSDRKRRILHGPPRQRPAR
jgi:hypothetical protein